MIREAFNFTIIYGNLEFIRLPRRLHDAISFDLSQHVTFGRYWSPSLVSLLPIPFIFGPVGGGESAPKAFFADFGFRGTLYEYARDVARFLGECDPLVKTTIRRANLILAPTTETRARLQHLGASRIKPFLGQTGISDQELDAVKGAPCNLAVDRFCFISISRLLHWKGIHLGIRAFARANVEDSEYWIVGEGPEREKLQVLAEQLNVSSRVRFWGELSREITLSKIAESHVLVHLSLHDFSPTVCLEAMAASRPVICLDIGGPSVQITNETGLRIAALTPKQVVRDVAGAMGLLAHARAMCRDMGEAGRKRVVSEFSWSKKAEILDSFYREVIRNAEGVT